MFVRLTRTLETVAAVTCLVTVIFWDFGRGNWVDRSNPWQGLAWHYRTWRAHLGVLGKEPWQPQHLGGAALQNRYNFPLTRLIRAFSLLGQVGMGNKSVPNETNAHALGRLKDKLK